MDSSDSDSDIREVSRADWERDHPRVLTRRDLARDNHTPRRPFYRRAVFTIAVAVSILVAIWLGNDSTTESEDLVLEFNCSEIYSLSSLLDRFPLPLPINTTAHRVASSNERDLSKTLPNKVLAQAGLVSSIKATSQLLGEFPTRASIEDFHHEILVVRKQLGLTTSNLTALYDLYHPVRNAYLMVNFAAADAKQEVALASQKLNSIQSQSHIGRIIGVEANKVYAKPWAEDVAKIIKARPGALALARETLRLELITQLLHQADRSLHGLVIAFSEREGKLDNHGNIHTWMLKIYKQLRNLQQGRSTESRQEWLKRTFRRYVLHNHYLQKRWDELLASVNEGDEMAVMALGHRFCVL